MILAERASRPGGPVYVLSDAHIGTGTPEQEQVKEDHLMALLDEIEERASSLVILGDLFDFWFEYRHVIPRRGFNVLVRLRELAAAGVPITFLGGNHDYWVGSFLERTLGLSFHRQPIDVECQGRRLFIAHGDGLALGDWGYRVIRKIFRAPLAIAAYRWIHPDLGIPLATTSSRTSRLYTKDTPVNGSDLWRRIAEKEFRRGRDAVIIGHFHKPVHVRREDKDFIINGDWMIHWSYTVIENGVLTLRLWKGNVVKPE